MKTLAAESDAQEILKNIVAQNSFQTIEHNLSSDISVNLFGLSDPAKIWYAAALHYKFGKKLVLVMPDEARARLMREGLTEIFPEAKSLIFRPREWTVYDARAVSRSDEIYRLAALDRIRRGDYDFLILIAASLLQRLPRPQRLDKYSFSFHLGEIFPPQKMEQKLLAAAYERVGRVESPGQYARRGDIIDIYPARLSDELDEDEAECLRISFFDIEIDEIKTFDPETQRSRTSTNAVYIPPARALILDEAEKVQLATAVRQYIDNSIVKARSRNLDRNYIEKLQRMGESDSERIENSIYFPALDRWLPLLEEKAATLLDYLETDSSAFIVDELSEVKEVMQQAQASFYSRLQGLIENADAPSIAADLQFSAAEMLDQYAKKTNFLLLGRLATDDNKISSAPRLDIECHVADRYRGRKSKMLDDMDKHLRAAEQVYMFTAKKEQEEHLNSLLLEHNLTEVKVSSLNIRRGFILPEAKLFLLGVEDIFGVRKKRSKRRRRSSREVFFQDLKSGSYVVHEDHGIGRYEGLETINTSDGERDYLHIHYADGDLHVAVDQFDYLTPYIHSGQGKVKLSRLGGSEWTRQKARAQDSIKKLATDLVALYSERQARMGHAFSEDGVWQKEFEALFPYEETDDQLIAMREIKSDMESPQIMDRLICGDVGFGKTELAFRAMFKAVMDGYQAVLLTPTTILCKQHFENLRHRVKDFPITVREMSRFVSREQRKKTLSDLQNGRVDMVVGTHRLLSPDVEFKKLGLLVIDEEQRFGVDHKEMIKAQHPTVDVLSLTATPIPRTLHMSLSGIRDISLLEEGPQDRRPVLTTVVEYDDQLVMEAIRHEHARQGQVFYLYNRARSIDRKVAELSEKMPGIRFVAAHGQMSEKRLERIISDFIDGKYDVLVCTTIIESGIDMPRVNTIIVEDADRLGLAQLYQLRGRVGRSGRQAYALITYRPDRALNEQAQKRLMAIRDFTELGSGFQIALRDLEVRGAGNLLGAEQSGHMERIGYDLYTKMLDEQVQDLLTEEEDKEQRSETMVELEVDAGLSEQYIPEQEERLDLYRRIAVIDDVEDYRDVLDEMIDRYGDPSAKEMALLDISYIRSFGERAGFERIRAQKNDVELLIDESNQSGMRLLAALMSVDNAKENLYFNAARRPHILVRNAAIKEKEAPAILRKLFIQADDTVRKEQFKQ